MMKQFKIIVEKHPDGYVAYPLGLQGIVIGEASSYEEALANVKSVIRFHIETFGAEVAEDETPVLEAFVAEARTILTQARFVPDARPRGHLYSAEIGDISIWQ